MTNVNSSLSSRLSVLLATVLCLAAGMAGAAGAPVHPGPRMLGPPVPDGDHLVGDTVAPGVYRAVGIAGEDCYWERASALGREPVDGRSEQSGARVGQSAEERARRAIAGTGDAPPPT